MTRTLDPHGSTRPDPTRRRSLTRRQTRMLLWTDAAACAAIGIFAVIAVPVGMPAIGGLLGVPEVVVITAGATLLVYAVGAGVAARAPRAPGLVGVAAANLVIAGATLAVAATAPLTVAGVLVAGTLIVVGLVVATTMIFAIRGL